MRVTLLAASAAMLFAVPSAAQVMIDLPIWSNGMLGQQTMRSTFDHYDETHDIDDEPEQRQTRSPGCSADALPAADRRRMEVEYVRRLRADGKPSADAWVREQGMRFRQKLIAEGVC